MKRVLLAIALLTLTACGGSTSATITTPAPPKQSVDQQLAGWLLAAQTAIEQAKSLVATNPGIKDPLNRLIAAYNASESSYLVYHQTILSGSTTDATALTAAISQLLQNVTALVSMYGGGKA